MEISADIRNAVEVLLLLKKNSCLAKENSRIPTPLSPHTLAMEIWPETRNAVEGLLLLKINSSLVSRIAKPTSPHRNRILCLKENFPTQTPSPPQSHTCTICHTFYKRKYHLKVHLRTHTGEKPYACKYCGKHFGRSDERTRHQRIHTNEKSHTCPYCEKAFNRLDHLKKHMLRYEKKTLKTP